MLRTSSFLVAFVMVAVLFSSCGGRSAQQCASDAVAGAKALQAAKDPVAKAAIAEGLAGNVLAALGQDSSLPPPTMTPDEILADSASYAATAKASQANPPPYDGPKSGPAAPGDGLHGWLEAWGGRLVKYGAAVMGACAGLFFLSLWPAIGAWISPWAKWIEEAAFAGGVVLLLGAGMSWLGNHLWLLYVISAAIAVLMAVRYRRKWLPVFNQAMKWLHWLVKTHPKAPTVKTTSP